jgi:hypothetical protein
MSLRGRRSRSVIVHSREWSDLLTQEDKAFRHWMELGLPKQTASALVDSNILSLDDLRSKTPQNLQFTPNLGPVGLRSIDGLLNPSAEPSGRFEFLPSSHRKYAELWVSTLGEAPFEQLLGEIEKAVSQHFTPNQRTRALQALSAIVRRRTVANLT